MSNILIQYDWNNHKEMSQKKLTNMFMKLSLSDKKKVYKVLSDKRKVVLRKGYDKWKKEQDIERIESLKQLVSIPFGDLLDISDLITENEIILTLGILLFEKGTSLRFENRYTSNHKNERESFENIKEKFIKFYFIMKIRKREYDIMNNEDELMNQLLNIEYIPNTLSGHVKYRKKEWLQCYIYIGVGKERAERITRALAKRLKTIESYEGEKFVTSVRNRILWEHKISDELKEKAENYYKEITNNINIK